MCICYSGFDSALLKLSVMFLPECLVLEYGLDYGFAL